MPADYKFYAEINFQLGGPVIHRVYRVKNAPSLSAASERLDEIIKKEYPGAAKFTTLPDENHIPIDNTSNDGLAEVRRMLGME